MSLALLPSWTQQTISSWRAVIAERDEAPRAGGEGRVKECWRIALGDAVGWFIDMKATHQVSASPQGASLRLLNHNSLS